MRFSRWGRSFLFLLGLGQVITHAVIGGLILASGGVPWGNIGFGVFGVICLAVWAVSKERKDDEMASYYTNSASTSLSALRNAYASLLNTPPGLVGASRQRFKGKAADRMQPVYGWRGYRMDTDGKLIGMREPWETSHKAAVCVSFNEHPTEMIRTLLGDDEVFEFWMKRRGDNDPARERCVEHLTNDSCGNEPGCGIWGRANPDEHIQGLVIARCMAYGVVAVDEDGNWRASDVQIESMFVNKQAFESDMGAYGGHAIVRYVDYDRMAYDLELRYSVPVKVLASVESLKLAEGTQA